MQDEVHLHIALCVQQCLLLHFTNDRVISRVFPITWPSYSPELNRCDFRLRVHFKRSDLGYLVTLADLKEGISKGICEKNLSRPDMIRSWRSYPQTADLTPSRREQYWAVFPASVRSLSYECMVRLNKMCSLHLFSICLVVQRHLLGISGTKLFFEQTVSPSFD